MSNTTVTVTTTPPDLFNRLDRYPAEIHREIADTMEAALQHVAYSVPPYPPPPEGSTYRRTGTLGRSIGTGGGRPDIYNVRRLGDGYVGEFGTNLGYAPRVIGDGTQQQPWAGYWWNIGDVAEKAQPGIIRLFERLAQKMADFIAGR